MYHVRMNISCYWMPCKCAGTFAFVYNVKTMNTCIPKPILFSILSNNDIIMLLKTSTDMILGRWIFFKNVSGNSAHLWTLWKKNNVFAYILSENNVPRTGGNLRETREPQTKKKIHNCGNCSMFVTINVYTYIHAMLVNGIVRVGIGGCICSTRCKCFCKYANINIHMK